VIAVTNIEWATWAAALGTFSAAVAAVCIAVWSYRKELHRNRVRVWEARRDQVTKDLDETRRLVMTAEYRPDALESPMVFGTILHAVVKHSGLLDDDKRTAEMLTRWWQDGSELNVLEEMVHTLDRRLDRLRSLPELASLDESDSRDEPPPESH
jgi:hypothetical protein